MTNATWLDEGVCLRSIQAIVLMFGEHPKDHKVAARLQAWRDELARLQASRRAPSGDGKGKP
jgi:hypothetical protein